VWCFGLEQHFVVQAQAGLEQHFVVQVPLLARHMCYLWSQKLLNQRERHWRTIENEGSVPKPLEYQVEVEPEQSLVLPLEIPDASYSPKHIVFRLQHFHHSNCNLTQSHVSQSGYSHFHRSIVL
jgi:hypothetical protein